MKQPWLKFFPSDWRSDPSLRMCSIAARGLWMEMLCLMHEAEPCGSLMVNGKRLEAKHLAIMTGVTLKEADGLLAELEDAGVFSRDEDGTIYSRRMRRDIARAERDRENGKTGGNPNIKKGVNPPVKPSTNPRGNAHGRTSADGPETRSQKPELEQNDRPTDLEPNGPASRSVSLSDQFKKRLREAVEPEIADDDDFGPIEVAVAKGATEADVLEAIQRAFRGRHEPGPWKHWSVLTGWIDGVLSDRKTGTRKPKAALPQSPKGPMVTLRAGFAMSEGELRKRIHGEGPWMPATMGPPPGNPGCLVPKHLLPKPTAA